MLNRLLAIFGNHHQEAAGPEAADLARSAHHDHKTIPLKHIIIQRLSEADGCLKQQQIVETTEWSASKVSKELTAMEEQGQISRFQLGQEKIIYLPEAVPESIRPERDESTSKPS